MMKMTDWCVKQLWGNDQYKWKDIPSPGMSDGLLTIWHNSMLECIDDLLGPNTLSQKFKCTNEDISGAKEGEKEIRWIQKE